MLFEFFVVIIGVIVGDVVVLLVWVVLVVVVLAVDSKPGRDVCVKRRCRWRGRRSWKKMYVLRQW